jgi:hypothetical protein
MLPSSSLTDPDVRISRIRFFTRKLRSRGIVLMDDKGTRQRISREYGSKARPRQIAVAPASVKPFLPDSLEPVMIPSNSTAVARDTVISAMSSDHPGQMSVLFSE